MNSISIPKKIAMINDIAGFGRCSATEAIPIISAMRVQVCPVPTSLFSNHTGFPVHFMHDCTPYLRDYLAAWKKLGFRFDGIYCGFLGSAGQIDIVREFLANWPGVPFILDPVMGDDGKLYPSLSDDLPQQMIRLVKRADIITPNLTEAMMLTGLDDGIRKLGQRDIHDLIDVLRSFGPEKGVITSIPLVSGGLGNAAWSGKEIRLFSYEDLGVSFPGAGDLFASVLYGLTLRGDSFFGSALHAEEIACRAIEESLKSGRERRLGIELYPALKEMSRRML